MQPALLSSAEMASRAGTGMEMDHWFGQRRRPYPYEMMLSESQERMLVVEQGYEEEVRQIFTRWDIESAHIGQVTTMASLESTMTGIRQCRQNISPKNATYVRQRSDARLSQGGTVFRLEHSAGAC